MGLIICLLLWLLFAPGKGLLYLHKRNKHLLELQEEKQRLVQQNSDIERDIERLKSDDAYLEQVAREEHGMLKDNEIVFDFNKKDEK